MDFFFPNHIVKFKQKQTELELDERNVRGRAPVCGPEDIDVKWVCPNDTGQIDRQKF